MVRRTRWMRLIGWYLIAAFSGLLAASGNLSVPAVAQDTIDREPSRNLDAEILGPGDRAEIDMLPGRLHKLPVSWFERRTVRVDGAHRMLFRTTGCAGAADTGLVVTWAEHGRSYTAFDNNSNKGHGNGRCSLIDTGDHKISVTYMVYVFSMTRGTSRASLQSSTGGVWTTQSTDDYGGTLVRVGALQSGDFLQVQTASDGVGDDGTQMLLFQPPASGATQVAKAAIFNAQQSTADRDPRITVDGSWSSPLNAVLLGKDTRNTTSLKGVETRVNLVRGPLEVTSADAALSCSGASCTGAQEVLPRGRYYASLFAITPNPLGGTANDAENYADALGTDGQGNCPHRPRGRGNDRAFTAVLKKNGAVLRQRAIPRGLLGEDAALDSYNRIIFEIDADGASRFSLDVTDKAADVTFFGGWRYVRNPDVNELKVASWNFGYWVFDGNTAARTAILHNAADLLGTRGDLDPVGRRVVEPANQAPWQWEADVIAFQEFYGDTYPHVRNRLQARTAFGWSWVNANTEIGDSPVGDRVYYGPVFVNEFWRPVEGIKYSNRQLDDGSSEGRCNSRWEGAPYDYACPLGWVDNVAYNSYNRAVPLKLRVRRTLGANAGTDRPIAFFNWHLYHDESSFDQRAENVENLIKSMKYLMARPADGAFPAGACAFNKECSNTPKHYANRIIVVGDSNMKNHQCGEFAWALRRLREEFGYAIDVAAASIDAANRTFDMHWSGAPITDTRMSLWGTCREKDGPWSKTVNADGTISGCPVQFQHRRNWNSAKDLSSASWYPWWAATGQDENGGEEGGGRLDVVFLVGRGWAYDDPVLSYKVMPHRGEASPMNGGHGGGVELGYDVSTCVGNVSDGNGNYAPKVSVNGCGTGEGAPAIRSDHLPVGARLRVWTR